MFLLHMLLFFIYKTMEFVIVHSLSREIKKKSLKMPKIQRKNKTQI